MSWLSRIPGIVDGLPRQDPAFNNPGPVSESSPAHGDRYDEPSSIGHDVFDFEKPLTARSLQKFKSDAHGEQGKECDPKRPAFHKAAEIDAKHRVGQQVSKFIVESDLDDRATGREAPVDH